MAFDASNGFILPNSAIRSPDAAWVRKERYSALTAVQRQKYVPLCPDFLVELRSASVLLENIQQKALLGLLATQQGKFWEYQDALFTQQDKLGEDCPKFACLEQFNRDRNLADSAIQQDMQLGQKLGVSGTPFFVMNGKDFSGAVPLEDMEKILAQVL